LIEQNIYQMKKSINKKENLFNIKNVIMDKTCGKCVYHSGYGGQCMSARSVEGNTDDSQDDMHTCKYWEEDRRLKVIWTRG
jgi:radical SAM protein with 4Fe4S-binding SPASM domain